MSRASTEQEVRVDVLRNEAAIRPVLYEETLRSLHAEVKALPAVWLYDARGSRLYDEITRLPEYYLPRREGEILRARAGEIAARTQARTLVELGAGSAKNIRLLLDALDTAGTLERFVPLDVSEETLRASAQAIAAAYPRVSVHAIVGDFERDLGTLPGGDRRLIAFLGSTIGNLYPDQRARFLANLGDALARDDAFLLGIDLVKDAARLEAAYNDSGGVTEAFVRNALTAVNRELDATFDQRRLRLRSALGSGARVDGHRFPCAAGAHGVDPRTRARRGVRGGRATPSRDQLEVPPRATRARSGSGRALRRIMVDRPCG